MDIDNTDQIESIKQIMKDYGVYEKPRLFQEALIAYGMIFFATCIAKSDKAYDEFTEYENSILDVGVELVQHQNSYEELAHHLHEVMDIDTLDEASTVALMADGIRHVALIVFGSLREGTVQKSEVSDESLVLALCGLAIVKFYEDEQSKP